MPTVPDNIPDNIEFAAKELLEAPSHQKSAMLESIAKALYQAFAAGQSWQMYPGGFEARCRLHQGSSGSPRIT
jgi:hypothetical protein